MLPVQSAAANHRSDGWQGSALALSIVHISLEQQAAIFGANAAEGCAFLIAHALLFKAIASFYPSLIMIDDWGAAFAVAAILWSVNKFIVVINKWLMDRAFEEAAA
ncbi:MAG TPA: hypothetical protein V6D17_22595 [Candidatus Obscuribacterales bacterium]